MLGLSCNTCDTEFKNEIDHKLHYKSEWHRYNLKRKVVGLDAVTEELFLERQVALAQDSNQTPMLYICTICNKGYRSDKALAQHLASRAHALKTSSQGPIHQHEETTIKPLQKRVPIKSSLQNRVDNLESEEWEEVGSDEESLGEAMDNVLSLTHKDIDKDDDDGEHFELDPSCCFMCDGEHDSIEQCMVHMHKQHGCFIPDIEYLKDPQGLLTYLGLKVKRDFICLYCNERCHPFSSLEAVRKHMEAKAHCKLHYGDGNNEEETELEEFYDYSSSYVDEDGKQLVAMGDMIENAEFVGSELIITRRSDDASTKTLGSREFLRYYRQKPRPSPADSMAITASLASRYRSVGLTTVQPDDGLSTKIFGSREFPRYYGQRPRPSPANYNKAITAALASRYRNLGLTIVRSRQNMVGMKVLKKMNRSRVEAMRTKLGMKNNIIRNMPKNVPH